MNREFRLYVLKESLKDEMGLSYRFLKNTNLIGAILFLINPRYNMGRRVEYSNYLGTEILQKKGLID